MMRTKSAITICSHWHDGQHSALYQYASTGVYTIENHLRYMQEIESSLHPEFALHPHTLNKKDHGNLTGLKWYFIRLGERIGIKTEYQMHPIYGYNIPFVSADTSDILASQVKPLRYAI